METNHQLQHQQLMHNQILQHAHSSSFSTASNNNISSRGPLPLIQNNGNSSRGSGYPGYADYFQFLNLAQQHNSSSNGFGTPSSSSNPYLQQQYMIPSTMLNKERIKEERGETLPLSSNNNGDDNDSKSMSSSFSDSEDDTTTPTKKPRISQSNDDPELPSNGSNKGGEGGVNGLLAPGSRAKGRRRSTLSGGSDEISRPFTCDQCPKRFAQKAGLQQHERRHSGTRPFPCSHCDKKFTQKSGLVQHERLHTGTRPYGCPHCEKRFTQRSGLDQHVRIHTGEKPYRCEVCGKCFTQLSGLKQHGKVHGLL